LQSSWTLPVPGVTSASVPVNFEEAYIKHRNQKSLESSKPPLTGRHRKIT